MDVQTLTTLISSIGFPIVACVAMFYQMNKQQEQHKQEVDKLSEAVENNTVVMQRILEHLDDTSI